MPKNISHFVYSIIQHTGYSEGGDTRFQAAVEESTVNPDALGAIHKAGGLIFQSYSDARDRAYQENYPPGTLGMIPKVRGKFKHVRDVGMVYIPERK